MAQGRTVISDSKQVDSRVSSFGILPEIDDPQPAADDKAEGQDAKKAKESDESPETDASEGDGEGPEDKSTEGAGDEGGDEGTDNETTSPEIAALTDRLDKAEDDAKRWQSRYDKAQAENRRLLERIASPSQDTNTGEDELSDIPDEDVLTGKQLKDVLARQHKRQAAMQQTGKAAEQRKNWVASRPDIQGVVKFMNENGLFDEDSSLSDMPTDEIGLYHAAKAMMLESEVKASRDTVKKEVEKALAAERKKLGSRKPVPPTGGTGAPQTSRSAGESLEPLPGENQYLNFFKGIGMPARVESARR